MSASALTCTGMPSLQSCPDEFTSSLAPPSSTAGKAPQKARCPGVKAALLFDLRLASVAGRSEVISDDFVQQPGHASIRAARCLLEAGFRRGRDPPRVYFSLSRHVLQCSAMLGVNQSISGWTYSARTGRSASADFGLYDDDCAISMCVIPRTRKADPCRCAASANRERRSVCGRVRKPRPDHVPK